MNLLSVLLKSLLADGAINALAKKTGIGKAALKKLLPLAIPLLLKAMTSNASSQSGALSLLGALTQHKNTKSMADQIAEADDVDGGKIIGHILGGNASSAVNSLALESGLSNQQVNSVLSGIAPALLSGLSAATSSPAAVSSPAASGVDLSDGFDLSDVMAMLGGGSSQSSGGMLGSLLGGGSSQSSGGLLGSLLGGGAPQSSGGLLGSLLGGSQAPEADNSLNGNALMSALLSAMR